MKRIFVKVKGYWHLIKSLQTGLLVATGMAGYMTARCPVFNLPALMGLFASLVTSISGSTILNMLWDSDIDALMNRTRRRPLPSQQISPREALLVGLALSGIGVGIALAMDPLFGAIIFAGLFFDVVIYTVWLKRRTGWSIVWGGIAGAMPILAGRTLGVGSIDLAGVFLGLGILLWIPTHILTFSMRYHEDYKAADIPTLASVYGFKFTQTIIASSSVLAALIMGLVAWRISMPAGFLHLLAVLSAGLVLLAVLVIFKPSDRINLGLFKYASVYMLFSMILMSL